MDLMEISDWYTFMRQPAPLVEWRLELLALKGDFQRKQADRISKGGQTATRSNAPPPDIDRSD